MVHQTFAKRKETSSTKKMGMQEKSVSEIFYCLWCKMEHVEEAESICPYRIRRDILLLNVIFLLHMICFTAYT